MPKIVDHETRRREIVEASWRVIAAEGLAGLTLRKIAESADCTTGRLTHYFANREEIVLAALRAVYSAAKGRMARVHELDASPQAKLLASLDETLPLDYKRLLEWKVWIAFWSAAAANPSLAKENDKRLAAWAAVLVPLIVAAAPGSNAALEAEILVGLVDGVGLQAAINPTAKNKRRARATVAGYVADLTREGRTGSRPVALSGR